MFKKFFSLFIILNMTLALFTGFSVSVSAEEQTGDGWTFNVATCELTVITNDGTTAWSNIISNKSMVRSVVIKSGVTSIGENAFRGCSSLTSVNIPNNVTSISNSAFYNCTSLTSVTIPNSVTSISADAFNGCTSLTSIEIPNSVETIGTGAFRECSSLETVKIPDSVTRTGTSVFYNCSNLKSVTISNGLSIINSFFFYGCSSLTSVTIPSGVTSIGTQAFYNCSSLKTAFYPDTCTEVANNAFDNTPATQIKYNVNGGKLTITDIIPNGDTNEVTIGTMDGQTADTIIYKDGLTVNGDIVSAATTKIEYTENDDGTLKITKIELGSGKTAADIPATISGKVVAEVAENCQSKVDQTSHTHTYNDNKCTLCGKAKEDDDPNTGGDTDSSVTLTVEDTTLTISPANGTGAVNSGDLSAAWDEEEYGDMGDITDVVIEDGVTSIGDGAFSGFTNLETVTIPDSVESIGDNAFDGTKLDTVFYESGANVDESDFPEGAAQVEYSVTEDGKIIIESIKQGDVISEDGKIKIPDTIGGMDVAGVAEEVRHLVSDEGHEHKGGRATCSALAVCSVCASEYGALDPNYHTYVNGVCTGCNAADPNAGSGSQGTSPTVTDPAGTSPAAPNPPAPSKPSAPSAPSNPSSPAVTTAAAETTVTATTAEEIIADNDYTGEDVSAGAAENSDDGGITDMSMFVILMAIAAAISAAVLVKKIVF